MIRGKIIQGGDSIYEYRDIWGKLYNSGAYEASTSFEWTRALISTILKKNDEFLLIVLRDSNEIVGIVPLVLSESRKYGLRTMHLFPISEYANTHSDILFKYLADDLIEAFISTLLKMEHKWDLFRMNRLIEASSLLDYMERCLNKFSCNCQIRRTEPSYYLTLDGYYDEYLAKRSSKFRNYLRRIDKKLKECGRLDVFGLEDFDNVMNAYEQLLAIEKSSWKYEHGTAIASLKNQQEFYECLCKWTSENGSLHLQFLYLDNDPIAYNMGLIRNDTYLYLKTSFDEKFRKFGPASILRAKLIEELIKRGTKYFDFPAEPYEWENQWTNELRWHKSIRLYKNTLKGKSFFFYDAFKCMAKKRGPGDEEFVHHNPKDIVPAKQM